MVNYMSHNQQERMPEPYNPLTAWNKQVPAFLASIDSVKPPEAESTSATARS